MGSLKLSANPKSVKIFCKLYYLYKNTFQSFSDMVVEHLFSCYYLWRLQSLLLPVSPQIIPYSQYLGRSMVSHFLPSFKFHSFYVSFKSCFYKSSYFSDDVIFNFFNRPGNHGTSISHFCWYDDLFVFCCGIDDFGWSRIHF